MKASRCQSVTVRRERDRVDATRKKLAVWDFVLSAVELLSSAYVPKAQRVVLAYRSQRRAVWGKVDRLNDVAVPQPPAAEACNYPLRQRVPIPIHPHLFAFFR